MLDALVDPRGLVVRPGEGTVIVEPGSGDPAQAPAGCESPAGGGGVRVALCGGEPQLPTRIDRVAPDGSASTIADTAEPSGHWRWARPSPDGRWVLGQWSGECDVPTAYLVPGEGGELQAAMGSSDGTVPESFGLGWAPDGRAVVWAPSGACGSGVGVPGVYLVDPDTEKATPVVVLGEEEPLAVARWTREVGYLNDRERAVERARRQLGLAGCCGEPSHGGDGATAGVVWEGVGVGVAGNPAGEPPTVPFTGTVTTPSVAGGYAAMGRADNGVVVAFTCGDTAWAIGGGMSDVATDEATVLAVAEALIPHLYCTLGEIPMVASATERPDGP